MPQIIAALVFVAAVGWCVQLYSEFRPSVFTASAPGAAPSAAPEFVASAREADAVAAPNDRRIEHPLRVANAAAMVDQVSSAGAAERRAWAAADEPAARIVAYDFDMLRPVRQPGRNAVAAKTARRKREVHLAAVEAAAPRFGLHSAGGEPAARIVAYDFDALRTVRHTEHKAAAAKTARRKWPVHLAAVEPTAPGFDVRFATDSFARGMPANVKAKTVLVNFQTAPFPYRGNVPGSNRPFLNAGTPDHRGHVTFRGRILWQAQTFSDSHVLLHIPPGFDPTRPAVMVVFFHGHGADLAHDVRNRQRVPQQITDSGLNAVLVAPQFAVDAADSSAGKFWEPNGFKRFLDEAASKLARLYGDPRSVKAFATMPIVLVAYSGGYGPALAVLARGGVRSRVRGLVLLDALYAGIGRFAEWIANHRSSFFVSSYTPHTAHHNDDLMRLLRERSVPFSSELRRDHLPGMVVFLPAGPVSHRNFVTHAWADNPIKNILARMDDVDPRSEDRKCCGDALDAVRHHNIDAQLKPVRPAQRLPISTFACAPVRRAGSSPRQAAPARVGSRPATVRLAARQSAHRKASRHRDRR